MIAYETFFKTVLTEKRKGHNIFQVVAVAQGRWSLTRSGHYERVDSKVSVKSGTGPEHRYLPIIIQSAFNFTEGIPMDIHSCYGQLAAVKKGIR